MNSGTHCFIKLKNLIIRRYVYYENEKELFIRLLSERRFKELKEDLMTMKAVDIASLLSQLDDKEIAIVFRLVPKDKAAEVFLI